MGDSSAELREPNASKSGTTPSESEVIRLQGLVMRQSEEMEMLRRGNEQSRMQLEVLRGDASTRIGQHDEELRVHKEAVAQSQKDVGDLREELRRAKLATKHLKNQNLNLQYHLNAWGIPISSGDDDELARLENSQKGIKRFFPSIIPLTPGVDPAPIVLRGDLTIFHFTSLLSFLESNNLIGVLTVVSEKTATKLYLGGGVLRLVSWNNREPAFSLCQLLIESELLTEEEVETYREENLYDLEVATRLLSEGKLDSATIRACLREHTRVIISQLFRIGSGTFIFQPGQPSYEKDLQFNLSITDLLLATAVRVDEESRNNSLELEELEDLEELGV